MLTSQRLLVSSGNRVNGETKKVIRQSAHKRYPGECKARLALKVNYPLGALVPTHWQTDLSAAEMTYDRLISEPGA